jgi:hypothetical protein
VLHQGGLVEHRQRGEIHRAVAQALAPERRVGAGVARQRVDALLLVR